MVGGEIPTEIPSMSLRDFLRWRRERKLRWREHRRRGETLPRPAPLERQAFPSNRDAVAWSGHASVIARLDGNTVLFDPIWSRRAAWIVKRLTPAAPEWDRVPTPQLVAISHNHYDHLDNGTVRRIAKETPVLVPRGVGSWFRRRRFRSVHEFEWWQTRDVDGFQVTFVPSRHFSGRTLRDRNKSLFGGWIIEGKRSKVYHSGDTGYFDGFRAIAERFRGIDVACLPVGAYEPRWFMSPVHVDPDEAGQAFQDLGAKRLLPIHWGTFRLTDEAMDEPPKRIRRYFEEKKLDLSRLLIRDLGEVVPLDTIDGE